VDHVLGLNSRL